MKKAQLFFVFTLAIAMAFFLFRPQFAAAADIDAISLARLVKSALGAVFSALALIAAFAIRSKNILG